MPKRQYSKIKNRRNNVKKNKLIIGKSNAAFILVLLFVASIAVVLGMGKLDFSDSGLRKASLHSCCDSGDREACKPNTSVTISFNGDTYGLLKSNIRTYELPGAHYHLAPFNTTDGRIFVNTTDSLSTEYPPTCVHNSANPVDFISEIVPGEFSDGRPAGRCVSIPNDILIYKCRSDNNPGDCDGMVGDARFDTYMRISKNEPVPNVIANCVKPPSNEDSEQKIINLPSPSGKPNLQLETFYVENYAPRANWVTPFCKPAVYLYPTIPTNVNVKVYPQGEMLVTIPDYPVTGWDVKAYPNGDIYSGKDRFDYLFYEAAIPDELITLPNEGYVIEYGKLSKFLPLLVSNLGLNVKETNQFSEYWLDVLPETNYYQIKVVSLPVLGKISPLVVTPFPKTTIRVALHFTPLEDVRTLPKPNIATPVRKGFTVVEWGGIFKRDANHNFSCFW